jgi:hypothetical protein
MRRRRSNRQLATLACALALAGARRADAQDVATEGALWLLVPIGARAVGTGQAIIATVDGSESVWWNPAGLARQEKREVAIHHSMPFAETAGDALSIIVPSSLLGVLAVSAHVLNFGEDDVTIEGPEGGVVVGSLLTRSLVFAASYATPVGRRLNAGVTYKVTQFRIDCSGECPASIGATATSSAVDLGAQYDFQGAAPIAVGVAVRNVGPPLQVNDRAQQDALPMRVQAGIRWRAPLPDRQGRDLDVAFAGDVLDRIRVTRPSLRLGGDATWQKRASLRAGYVFDGRDASGASVGVGVRQGGLVVDIARVFGGLAATSGGDPVSLSVRYLF